MRESIAWLIFFTAIFTFSACGGNVSPVRTMRYLRLWQLTYLRVAFLSLVYLLCALTLSCGGNGNPSIQTASISITPTSASLQALSQGKQKQQFHALVTGTTNSDVIWLVNGIAGGNASVGTITASGLYTAPNEVPAGMINITANIANTNTSSNSASVMLQYPHSVVKSVTPATIMQGSGTTVVTLTGGPFSSAADVWVNNFLVPATVISITQVAATIPAPWLISPATLSLNPSNPGWGGSVEPIKLYVVPGEYVRVGDLNVARHAESATLLPNGKVLVAGGGDASNALRSTEIFDPQTNLFQIGPNMISVSGGNTAILLNNEKVLIAGGSAASADLYDPLTDAFTAIPPPGFPLEEWATLLSNGQVLFQSRPWSSPAAEVYDPGSNSFTQVPSANIPLWEYPADPCFAVPAGNKNLVVLGLPYYFHPSTLTYTSASHFTYPGWQSPCVVTALNDGRFFIKPGATYSRDYFYYFGRLVWDPQADAIVGGGSQFARYDPVAVTLQSGRVLILGGDTLLVGYTPFSPYPDEVFDPATGSSFVAPFPLIKRRRPDQAVLLQDGRVLVLNGEDDGSVANVIAETYVPPPATVGKVH